MTAFSQPERRGLERMQAANAASHPDADLLTALAEHSLTTREQDQVLAHLAVCASCREVIALAGSPLVEPVPEPARKRGLWEIPLFHWGAAAATTVVVVAAVLLSVRQPALQKLASPTVAIQNEQLPAAVAPNEDKVVAEPRAKGEPSYGLQASTAAPAESAPSQPRRALHLQQQARYERPSPATAKKQEVASAASPGAMHGSALGGPVAKTDTRDFAYSAGSDYAANSNSVLKNKAADLSPARAVPPPPPPPATLAQNAPPTSGASGMTTVEAEDAKAKKDDRSTAWAAVQVAPQSTIADEKVQGFSAGALRKAGELSGNWQISNGKLQHSAGSKAWQTVLPNQTFRCVATVQNQVWAGGDKGLLYHSPDNGQTWTPISVKSGTIALAGNITGLNFTDIQHGSAQTSTGETWITSDGGNSWQKE